MRVRRTERIERRNYQESESIPCEKSLRYRYGFDLEVSELTMIVLCEYALVRRSLRPAALFIMMNSQATRMTLPFPFKPYGSSAVFLFDL